MQVVVCVRDALIAEDLREGIAESAEAEIRVVDDAGEMMAALRRAPADAVFIDRGPLPPEVPEDLEQAVLPLDLAGAFRAAGAVPVGVGLDLQHGFADGYNLSKPFTQQMLGDVVRALVTDRASGCPSPDPT